VGEPGAEFFDGIGREYEAAYSGLVARDEEREWSLTELPPRARVLDVGCGTGRPSAELLAAAGHEVTGRDISSGMIEIARAQVPGARFEVADLRTLAFPRGVGTR
jgi:ubiquinone/menaquinone biosynthesis C-methylase UbiE